MERRISKMPPTLYKILEENDLKKYPVLPGWVLQKLKTLEKGSENYVEFTRSIFWDKNIKNWTGSLSDY
jgi:hypothetical protein